MPDEAARARGYALLQRGLHRRIVLEALLVYKEGRDRERLEAPDEVTRISGELGLYDEQVLHPAVPFVALPDASVLYPACLRELLLRLTVL